ncbi:MAG: hypothetical protein ACRETS_05710, partial [Steroidobacteraceae bacterium]
KIYGGMRTKAADDYSAALLEQEAGQSVASGIQGAIMERRKATYVASSARARIAAGGLATTGPSAIATVGQIRGQGEYNALTSLYGGYDRAAELAAHGSALRNEGGAASTAGWLSGVSSVLTGGTSFYDKYGATASPTSPGNA